MQVSGAGLKLIAEFEGFSAYLYNDPVGHATVAYGILVHTGNYHEQRGICAACDQWPREIERDKWLTYEQGRQLLADKVKPYAAAVERLSRPLKQQEFDALTSLCYNIGQGGYERSGVRKAVNKNGDVCAALRLIVKGTDGVTYPGLVRRREAECKMFYGPAPARSEEDDMAAIELVWNPEFSRLYVLGQGPPVWIADQAAAADLTRAYGQPQRALAWATLKVLGAA